MLSFQCKKKKHREIKTTTMRSCLHFGELETKAMLTTLLVDEFISSPFDPAVWDVVAGSSIDSNAINPTTAPFTARFSGGNSTGSELRSASINLDGMQTATLSYAYQRTGGGTKPLESEDLVIEIKLSDGQWEEIDRRFALGPDPNFVYRT